MSRRSGAPRTGRWRTKSAETAQTLSEKRLRAAIRNYRRLGSDPVRLEMFERELHARGLSAEPTEHQHVAVETYSHPPYNPSRFEETCECGMTRYRVKGGPWTQWELEEGETS